ncbi:MAG: hypothetical protein ACYS9T_01265 [Planctomycetota bacterium]
MPINGQYTAIGNDFYGLYCKYKIYLLASLADFHFPLWSPAGGAGYPFRDNPFAQALYPFNLPMVLWYKMAGGYGRMDHQLFTILGISIFALGLFMWLRQVNNNLRAVLFSTLVMSVSFKMTEILRFPNAVHTAAWYPWMLYSLTKVMFSPSLKKAAVGGALLTVFSVFFCTGGYPYFLYYATFLFVPYLAAFLAKPLRTRLFGSKAINWNRTFFTLAIAAVIVSLICGPYLLRSRRLIADTAERPEKDFEYATKHVFTFEDTLGSLVYPPAASAEGWYFFSITAVLLIFLYLLGGGRITCDHPGGREEQREGLMTPRSRNLWTKLFFIIWIAMITYISYGRNSYLFILLWKFMPGFSSLRNWGRLNIILVPIIAWLLSLAYASFESMISGESVAAVKKSSWVSSPIAVSVMVYAAALGVQLYLYLNNVYDSLWLWKFQHLSPKRILFIVYGALAFAAILFLVTFGKRIRTRSGRFQKVVVTILIMVAVLEMRSVGNRMWTYQQNVKKDRIRLDIAKINQASFRFPRTDYNNSIALGPRFSVGILENWYFSRYIKFLKETEDELQARRIFLGVHDGTKIFFSKSIGHATVESFLRDAMLYRPAGHVLSYTGDKLRWEIQAPVEGYLSFIDNWAPGWKVSVDDKPAEIELLFGTFKSVRLTPGQHRVRFCYQPRILFLCEKTGSE